MENQKPFPPPSLYQLQQIQAILHELDLDPGGPSPFNTLDTCQGALYLARHLTPGLEGLSKYSFTWIDAGQIYSRELLHNLMALPVTDSPTTSSPLSSSDKRTLKRLAKVLKTFYRSEYTRPHWIFLLSSVAYHLSSGRLSSTPEEIKDKLEKHGRLYTVTQIQNAITTIKNLQQEENHAMQPKPNTSRTHYRITPPSLDYPHKEQDLTPGDLFQFSDNPQAWYICTKDNSCSGAIQLRPYRGIIDKDSPTQDASLIIFSEVEIIITKR
jgi:hypothetical protein